MDWKFKASTEWDWENLASYSGRAIEIPKHDQLPSQQTEGNVAADNGSLYSSGGSGFSGSGFGHCSSSKSSVSASMDSLPREGTKSVKTVDSLPQNFSEKEEFTGLADKRGNFGSGEPIIGLKLGRRTYFEDMCAASTTTSKFSVISTSSPTTKRSRASYQNLQTPRCQVEGCNLDLASAKDYHRRHRICESHSKSPKVIVAGMERRFCQQCSRFHELSEFDDKKRSCRRRLSDHNARRRKPQPEAIQFSSAQLPSSLYDQRPQTNFLPNGVPFQAPNPAWESACSWRITGAGDSLIGTAKAVCINRKPSLPNDDIPNAVCTSPLDSDRVSAFQGTAPRVLCRGFEASPVTSNLDVAPDLRHALSLLSTNSWGLNEPTSFEQLVQGNHTSVPQQPVLHSEQQQNWASGSSEYERMDQAAFEPRVPSLDVNSISSSQFQEFQLFKAPQDSECFYSNQIN